MRRPPSGLAGALAVAGILWLTGEIAGRLSQGTWPGTNLSEMGHVLVRFHAHAGDPAAAWPTPERRLIPGPVSFYATLAALLLPLAAAALLVLRRRLSQAGSSHAGHAGHAGATSRPSASGHRSPGD